MVANSISCNRTNPRSADESFALKGLSVVNGAQTCGALARSLRAGVSLDDVRVTVRVISMAGHSPDFEKLVTRYTNTQNQVTNREFVALDPYQQELRDILLAERIQYSFRSGLALDDDECDFAFDLEEATRALACLSGVDNATRAKREIGRMWSDLESNPYLELFPRDLDAITMYNSVRFWRAFTQAYYAIGRELTSRQQRIVVNSVYMACSLMMQEARADGKSFSEFDWDVESWILENNSRVEQFADCVVTHHEEENSGGFPMSFFKHLQKVDTFAREVRALFRGLAN
ncbi:AIPR family protein [Arthrobacter agilis]|uniref:AIPR family protein n=1 Tax=Arthrobacter agilis TaxID=37921 RepID=UPI00236596B5|nr:AIPR family protein [Arthrobacter agilis]WDF34983.1 AIPR family protein [Arthrobacter agilis]